MHTVLLFTLGLATSEASPQNLNEGPINNFIIDQDTMRANGYRGPTVVKIPKKKKKKEKKKEEASPLPKQEVQEDKQLSLGLRGMSYQSGFAHGGTYRDSGWGLAFGYRLKPQIGAEISYSSFSEDDRTNQPIQAVGQFFMMPDKRVQPFLSAGLSWNNVDLTDTFIGEEQEEPQMVSQSGRLTGPVIGAGLGASISDNFSLSAEGRYLMYNNISRTDLALDRGVMLNAGLNFHF